MMRQVSWMWFLGFGLKACTMSGNFMPSRMKKTLGRGIKRKDKGTQDNFPAPSVNEKPFQLQDKVKKS